MGNYKLYSVLPLIQNGEVFAVLKERINVFLINPNGLKGFYNVYVEDSNGDLKFVTGLSENIKGEKLTEKVIREFVEAAATDELVRRADEDDDSVEFFKSTVPIETVAEARDLFFEDFESNELIEKIC